MEIENRVSLSLVLNAFAAVIKAIKKRFCRKLKNLNVKECQFLSLQYLHIILQHTVFFK